MRAARLSRQRSPREHVQETSIVGARPGRLGRAQPFQHHAALGDGHSLLHRHGPDAGAPVRDAFHQAYLFKLEKRQPHIAAMGVELFAEILLDQALLRLTPPEHDILLDTPCDHEGRRRLPRR